MLSTYNRHTTADITVREINAVGNKSMFILRYINYVLFCVSVFLNLAVSMAIKALCYKLENSPNTLIVCRRSIIFFDGK